VTADGGPGGSSFFGTAQPGLPGIVQFVTVPEPATACLFAFAACLAVGIRRPRRGPLPELPREADFRSAAYLKL
jgi:hypothetical protein